MIKHWKPILALILVSALVLVGLGSCSQPGASAASTWEKKGFRAVWVSTVYRLDYPSQATTDPAVLKADADKILKNETKWSDVPEFAEVLDKYLELYQKGYVNSNFASATYDDAIAAVADGTAAMHFNGDFFASSVLEANPEAKIGMFPVSMKEGTDVITENMSSAGFVAYKNSENLDVVKKIFDLWSTPEYANLYFADRPAFPAFQDVDGGKVPDYLAEINENYIKEGKAIPEFNYYVMTLNPLFESSLYVYYVDAPAKGTMDGKAVMEKFQKDYEQYMKDQGAEGF